MVSALLIHGVPVECINKAAVTYFVPAKVIISVLAVEGGRVGMAKKNTNDTYDYGPMQINSVWLKRIAPYGYTRNQLQYNPCINVMVGTWILSKHIADSHSYWQGVGDYHSYTINLNQAYQEKVHANYKLLASYLEN